MRKFIILIVALAHGAFWSAKPGPQGSASLGGTLRRRSWGLATPWAAISSRCQPANTDALQYAHKTPPLASSHAAATVNASVSALAVAAA